MATATIALGMQFAGTAGAWTDVWGDVRNGRADVRYGIFGASVQDRVADIGELTFSLDNSASNTAGSIGYYSPDHANLRSGFAADIPSRLEITFGGTAYYKFTGWLRDINPEFGAKLGRSTSCRVEDWMGVAARSKVERIPVQEDKTGDQLLTTVLATLTRQPVSTDFSTGQSTFDIAMDTSRDENTTVMRELQKIAISELAFIYQKGDTSAGGKLAFESRHDRAKVAAAQSTLTDAFIEFDAGQSTAAVYNKVRVRVHPRTIDDAATTVLYALVNEIELAAGETKTHIGYYTDENQRSIRSGGMAMVTPTATTDYLMNDTSGGGGVDLTASLSVTADYGGNSVEYTLENTGGQAGFVTKLQARGKGVYDQQPSTLEATDEAGDSQLDLDMPYLSDELIGQDAANYLQGILGAARTLIPMVRFYGNSSDANMIAGLTREPGDRVTLTEQVTGVDSDWFINGVEIEITSPNIIKFGWALVPRADVGSFWLLGEAGASELDETTVLGY